MKKFQSCNKLPVFLILVLFSCHQLWAQELTRFEINLKEDKIDAPVSVTLDAINYNTDKGDLFLYETTGGEKQLVPCQLETGHTTRIWFVLKGISKKNTTREFSLRVEKDTKKDQPGISLDKDNRNLTLMVNEKSVLSYRHALKLPPKGIDPLYERSGYIHPLVSPGGEVLTRIQAPDHYHHYGIWGPWTKTHIGDRAIDFWNLALGEGTVKFAGFLNETEGSVFSGFKSLQQHIDFGAKGKDEVAMNEILDVRAWNAGEKIWIVDYTTTLNCPLKEGIMLDAYRYGGGIGFRATEKWHKENCTVLTSDNKTRVDADGSYARWCIVEGESDTGQGRSGILFLSHPSNRMHPEPMRIWPLDANGGRGDMYFEFVPIRHDDWKLEKGKNYTLKYRMIIFDGKMETETAEMYWNSFATHPEILFTR